MDRRRSGFVRLGLLAVGGDFFLKISGFGLSSWRLRGGRVVVCDLVGGRRHEGLFELLDLSRFGGSGEYDGKWWSFGGFGVGKGWVRRAGCEGEKLDCLRGWWWTGGADFVVLLRQGFRLVCCCVVVVVNSSIWWCFRQGFTKKREKMNGGFEVAEALPDFGVVGWRLFLCHQVRGETFRVFLFRKVFIP
ncbi:hypothetical protein AABB24_028472 [Solanum stoloniferum]|uniref:Transmembrane protein n=1 Tax=Solanum stoloniferum TaxID=62892 RepID=A0ABD2S725_9SOLN